MIVVRGEAGAGKTALLDDAVARARGLAGPRARVALIPRASSASPRWRSCASHCSDQLPRLPAARAAALASALGSRLAASSGGSLRSLRRHARPPRLRRRRRPRLLVVVDDAHLLDEASAEAIAFIARRLRIDGIALADRHRIRRRLVRRRGAPARARSTRRRRAVLAARFGDELAAPWLSRSSRAGKATRSRCWRSRATSRRSSAAREAPLDGSLPPSAEWAYLRRDRGAAARHAPGAAACGARRGGERETVARACSGRRPRRDGAGPRRAGRAGEQDATRRDVLPRARAHRRLLLGAGAERRARARRAGRRRRGRAATMAPGPRRHRPRRRGRRGTRAAWPRAPATRAPYAAAAQASRAGRAS